MNHMIKSDKTISGQYSIFAGKFRRYHGIGLTKQLFNFKTNLLNLRDFIYFVIGLFQSIRLLAALKPDVVFVKGGYVGLPVGLASALLKIPIVTHDSDSIPGLTNRMLSKYATIQAVGMPVEFYQNIYRLNKMRFSGIPIRSDFLLKTDTRAFQSKYNLLSSDKIVAVLGGSLGAARLNDFIFNNIKYLGQENIKLIWLTGSRTYKHYHNLIQADQALQKQCVLLEFSNDIPQIMALADIVVSRAGATSIAELAAMSKPSIIVPNPMLTGGHQTVNANNLAGEQAVINLSETELAKHPSLLGETITGLMNDDKLRAKLASNIHRLAITDASQRIVACLVEAAGDKQ